MTNQARDWIVYSDEDGMPWAIFLDGHGHDLRTLRSLACKEEMRQAFIYAHGDDEGYFHGNLNVGRWWIKDHYETENEDADPDYPWHFCAEGEPGARPISGAKFT